MVDVMLRLVVVTIFIVVFLLFMALGVDLVTDIGEGIGLLADEYEQRRVLDEMQATTDAMVDRVDAFETAEAGR